MSDIRTGVYLVLEMILRVMIHPRLRARLLKCLGARVGENVRIYDVRFINLSSGFSNLCLERDVHIGTDCLIDLQGPVTIGQGSVLAPRVVVMSHSDPGSSHGAPLCNRHPPEANGVVVGRDCWLGAGAIVLSGSIIGDEVTLGAGALARGVLRSGKVYVGVPARELVS